MGQFVHIQRTFLLLPAVIWSGSRPACRFLSNQTPSLQGVGFESSLVVCSRSWFCASTLDTHSCWQLWCTRDSCNHMMGRANACGNDVAPSPGLKSPHSWLCPSTLPQLGPGTTASCVNTDVCECRKDADNPDQSCDQRLPAFMRKPFWTLATTPPDVQTAKVCDLPVSQVLVLGMMPLLLQL